MYKELLEWIDERIENEETEFAEAKSLAGMDSPGACLALGARDVLVELKQYIEILASGELRTKYRDLRASLCLTLRDASKLLGISPVILSTIEVGQTVDFEVDTSVEIGAICHRCEEKIKVHPIKNAVFPSYICKKCMEEDKEVVNDKMDVTENT